MTRQLKKSKSNHWRVLSLSLILFLLGSLIAAKLFYLQVINRHFYRVLAQDQHQIYQQIIPQRGEIFIQDKYNKAYFPVAINRQQPMLYAVPRQLNSDPKDLAAKLAEILKIPSAAIQEHLMKKDDPFEPLKTKLTEEEAAAVEELNCPALGLLDQTQRYYPASSLASQVIGFLGYEGELKKGQYGIEGYYNNELAGQIGIFEGEKDTVGRWINLAPKKIIPSQDGPDLVLSLDQNVQFMIEEKLDALARQWQPEEGVIIVIEPQTGAVRGLANWPSFDLNQYSRVDNLDIFLNRATQKLYEPGSVFKPIVVAAALEQGKITPETTYTDTGLAQIGGYTIRNADDKVYGVQNISQILEHSINTGVIFIERQLGDKLFLEYLRKFGFAEPTGIDLAGERSGNISNLLTGRPINFATAAFGQGIAVTPLQLISAISAIANKGRLMRPFLVENKIMSNEEQIPRQPEVRQEVISEKTAAGLTQMLVNSVERGFAKKAQVPGYRLAGKTGTAQIPNSEGGYSETETLHSFVGFGPAENPQFAVLIMLVKPQGNPWASHTVTPAFREIAEYLLDYYEIPPNG